MGSLVQPWREAPLLLWKLISQFDAGPSERESLLLSLQWRPAALSCSPLTVVEWIW